MIITIINTQEELNAFPVDQKIKLKFSVKPEDSFLSSCVVLHRDNKEFGLFNLGSSYNNSIGYIKENFESIPLTYNIYSLDSDWIVECIPKELLKPSSFYSLYIDKSLKTEFLVLAKSVDKGPSTLKIKSVSNKDSVTNLYTVKVVNNPTIVSGKLLTKFAIYLGTTSLKTFIVDVKSAANTFEYDGIVFETSQTPYALDEEFQILLEDTEQLGENLKVQIRTNIYESITSVESDNISTKVTNADILEYYQNKDNTQNNSETVSIIAEYLDTNVVAFKFIGVSISDIPENSISFKETYAFNNYTLPKYDLYVKDKTYSATYEYLYDDNIIIMTIEES